MDDNSIGKFLFRDGALQALVHRSNRSSLSVTFRVNNSVNARLTPQKERKVMELINQSK